MDPYLLRKLEESHNFYAYSYSNRYMNWKRRYSITESVRKYLHKLPNKNADVRILDAGCSEGSLVYHLKTMFDKSYRLEFTGVDISDLDIDFAKHRKEYFSHTGCEFRVADLQSLDFSGEVFDIIICTEVIEHIPDPSKLANNFFRFLKNGGLFIVTTPNEKGNIFVKAVKALKLNRRFTYDLINDVEKPLARLSSSSGKTGAGEDHVSVKSISEWKKIFLRCGFKVQAVRGTAGLFFGNSVIDRHRMLVAMAIIVDTVLEALPWSYLWSEVLFFELRK